MKFTNNREVFSKCLSQIKNLIFLDKSFPEKVFKEHFPAICFINSDEIFVEGFMLKIKSFLESISEDKFNIIVLEPDPEEYFFHHFNKYPLFEVSVLDQEDDYFSIIEEDPGNSPADAIRYNSRVLLLYSTSLNWAIYINRDYEVGIIGAKKSKILEQFVSSFGKNRVFNSEQVIEEIFPLVFSSKTAIPANLITSFRNNYRNSQKNRNI